MKSLTIGFCTSRKEPRFEWFFDSLNAQGGSDCDVVVVDLHHGTPERFDRVTAASKTFPRVWHVPPKPTVFQGSHRLTQSDWWAVSNSRNTALCLTRGEYVVWVDDRCVLQPKWLQGVREAMSGNYGLCGTYEKRVDMKVENGAIVHGGTVIGEDCRKSHAKGKIIRAYREWFFGGTLGMPTEWALSINGFDERMDSLSMEDVMCGIHLYNGGYMVRHDPRVFIIEDRTPSELGEPMKRSSKERWPHDEQDKTHEALRRFGKQNRADHYWDLRAIRERALRGEPFPVGGPVTDWYDGQPISEMI